MRIFRDEAWFKRAVGIAVIAGLLAAWARHWRDDISSRGTYTTSTYDVANNWMDALAGVAIVAVVYVALCLLLTPRARNGTVESRTPGGD
jgi:hypothetical protein